MGVYENVKQAANNQNISIAALEAKAGVANGTIAGWKNGKPYLETFVKVANALDIPIEVLLEEVKP